MDGFPLMRRPERTAMTQPNFVLLFRRDIRVEGGREFSLTFEALGLLARRIGIDEIIRQIDDLV